MIGVHIVQVANFYGPRSGGLRTTLQALGRGYQEAGHEFSAVVAGAQDDLQDNDFGRVHTIAAPGVPGSGGYRMITRPGRVRSLLEEIRPDRLEVSDRSSLHGLGRWARRRGVPTVFFAHERVDGVLRSVGVPAWMATRGADLRNRSTVRSFDTVVATTGFAAREFERVGTPQLRRVALGVDLALFTPGDGSGGRRLELVLCSRLSVEKAPELAVDALIELRRRGVDAGLTVAGDGPRRPALQERAAGHPVRFLGFVRDRSRLADLLGSADIALAPGPIETFGLAALECLATGTPVVVNARSALPEVIGRDPGSGRAASTAEGFADAVQALAEIPAAHRRRAARARAEQFPWSATVAGLLALHGAPVSGTVTP